MENLIKISDFRLTISKVKNIDDIVHFLIFTVHKEKLIHITRYINFVHAIC